MTAKKHRSYIDHSTIDPAAKEPEADTVVVPPTDDGTDSPRETLYSTRPAPYSDDTVGGPGITPTHA